MTHQTSTSEIAKLGRILQDASIKCSERCLYQSAKWAAEMLNSLPQPPLAASPTDTEIDSPMEDIENGTEGVPSGVISHNDDPRQARLEAAEVPKYIMAKMYFNCREYDRCAAVFLPDTLPKGQVSADSTPKAAKSAKAQGKRPAVNGSGHRADDDMSTSMPHLSEKALFLALYAKYMSGEKRKDEDSEMILGPADNASMTNKELPSIIAILKARLDPPAAQDSSTIPTTSRSFLHYLYAVALSKSKNTFEAKGHLILSIRAYAFNWSAWTELALLLTSLDDLRQTLPHLPQNLLTLIFNVHALQSLFQADPDAIKILKQLKAFFPASSFLKTQKALLLYHGKDFDRAAHVFAKLLARDPYRLDDLDAYSNILYVMESRAQLAYLAHLVTAVDRFRPESACVVGNYYALKSEHEKAILYFRRALTLDRSFLSAWTLMGHEYVELKNTQAAIECYRRAVDANRKDYRAWYGLGQTYEVLDMHLYALWYYQRAAALCPYDAKMWTAVGACLGKMGRADQAIGAYKRALQVGSYYEHGSAQSSFGSQATAGAAKSFSGKGAEDEKTMILDPDVLYAIAMLHYEQGNKEELRSYLELVLEQEEGTNGQDRERDGESPDGESPEERLLRSSIVSNGGLGVGGGGGTFTASTTAVHATSNNPPNTAGVGVTATTCRARHLLCKLEMERGGKQALGRALELANELCQDGWEVEDAKALMRDIRGRLSVDVRN
ncbi:MAG: hypothetical protein Q9159_000167 [Coniocarpon cinnabarinum]